MTTVSHEAPARGLDRERLTRFSTGVILLALFICGVVGLCWTGFGAFLFTWERPEYSHGYLIAPIALFLFLNELRTDTSTSQANGRLPGLLVLGFAILVSLVGNLARMPNVTAYGIIVFVAAIVLITMGTRRGLRYWPAVIYLLFMLPLPTVIYWRFSLGLQFISSEIGVRLIDLFGVPVFLDGNVIDLGAYKLQVAEACSGLRYLFPLMSFGYLFAVLFKGRWWQKLILFAATVPITIGMNSLRIGVIGLLVDRFGIAQAEGFLHAFEGWIIFVACVAILYLLALILQLASRHRVSIARMMDIDFAGLAVAFGRIRSIPFTAALLVAAVIVPLVALAWQVAPSPQPAEIARTPLALFPLDVGDWRASNFQLLDRDTERVLFADDYMLADYAQPNGPGVNMFVAYYYSLNGGGGLIHSPEQCLPGGGWELSAWSTIDTGIASPTGGTLSVNRATMRNGLSRQLVYFFLIQGGQPMTSLTATKLSTLFNFLSDGRSDGGLVRFITPILPSESEQSADARLRTFIGDVADRLPPFIAEVTPAKTAAR